MRLLHTFLLIVCTACFFLGWSACHASTLISIDNSQVIVCPAEKDDTQIPDFGGSNCRTTSFPQINPQNQHLWVKASVTLPSESIEQQRPAAFYLFARTSSEVYFNRTYLGRNGTPSSHANNEFVGKMDARFYIPKDVIKSGENEVIMRLSAHHGLLTLTSPMHFAGVGEFQSALHFYKDNMLLLVFLLGLLLLGTVYLAAISIGSPGNSNWLLFIMTFCVLGQISGELARGLFNYDYPIHDIRLILIVVFALGFGLALLAFCLKKIAITKEAVWLAGSLLVSLSLVSLAHGFDLKTVIAIVVPSVIANALVATHFLKERHTSIGRLLLAISIFNLIALANLDGFHDDLFFLVVSSLMVLLSANQAYELLAAKKRVTQEQKLTAKLELRLAQAQQEHTPTKIKLTSTGRTQILNSNDILFCQAAGDYIEICMTDNKRHLFAGSLKSIAEQLPETFMRIHRSHIVNLNYVSALKSSSGELQSQNELIVAENTLPVSRRLLPEVRKAIIASR